MKIKFNPLAATRSTTGQSPSTQNFFSCLQKISSILVNFLKILVTPIFAPKQPKTIDNPPIDSQMLFTTLKKLEKNKINDKIEC